SISGKGNRNRFPLAQYSLTSRQVFVDGPKRGAARALPGEFKCQIDATNSFRAVSFALGSRKNWVQTNFLPNLTGCPSVRLIGWHVGGSVVVGGRIREVWHTI